MEEKHKRFILQGNKLDFPRSERMFIALHCVVGNINCNGENAKREEI